MISASVTAKSKNASQALTNGLDRYLREIADKGFQVSQERVPHGADSFLAQSGFEPRKMQDGSYVWGYSADYAQAVEDGSDPHWIPIRAMPELKKWARRILGDESAAWNVRWKIAQEGTPAQPYVEPGIVAMRAKASAEGVGRFIDAELEGSFE